MRELLGRCLNIMHLEHRQWSCKQSLYRKNSVVSGKHAGQQARKRGTFKGPRGEVLHTESFGVYYSLQDARYRPGQGGQGDLGCCRVWKGAKGEEFLTG